MHISIDSNVYALYAHGMNNAKRQKTRMIYAKLGNIIKLTTELEMQPRSYGTDELLTSTEIHLIEMIGNNGELLSVTDLSKQLSVTKGAISQSLKRLSQKGLTTKVADPENGSRSIVRLTSKGKVAFYAHRHWHETMDGGYETYFNSLESERLDFLLEFMERLEGFLGRVIKT